MSDFQESSAKKRNGQQMPCTYKERKSVSVVSVCVLGEPWLELLADRLLLLLLLMRCVTETLLSNFSEARLFCFLNKARFSTLSLQSAGFFSGKRL